MWIRLGVAGLVLVLPSIVSGGEAGGPDPAWRRTLGQEIAALEYHVSPASDGVLCAPNRAHDLRLTFRAEGVTARPRTGEAVAFEWGLEYAGFGRGDVVAPPLAATPVASVANGNRVEYARGDLVEWYVNDAQGLEQGFTIGTRPAGVGDLVVVLRIRGTLAAFERDGGIDFATSAGAVALRYDHLAAFDANKKALCARMLLADGAIRLAVDDEGAAYPVTIDPLTTYPTWTAEGDQAEARFGWSVATAGDVNGDGYSDVIVGAPYFDGGSADEGRVFVYHGSATGLAASPAWIKEGSQAAAHFGCSVATAGDVNGDGYSDVIVGAWAYNKPDTDEGTAYVYLGSATGLAGVPAWTGQGNQPYAEFGWSVATAGDVNGDGYSDIIVGARKFDDGQANEGRAFVYLGSPTGLAAGAAWIADGNQATAFFGHSVATAGDVNADGYSDVVVGAVTSSNGESNEGRAFVYLGSAGGLAASPAWIAEGDQAGAWFGSSVATAGDVNGDGYADVIVGAQLFDSGEWDEGRAFVYLGSAMGLATSPAWSVEGDQGEAYLGISVATAGDVNGDGYCDVIVGASLFDNGQADEGRAFVYLGSAAGLAASPAWTGEGNQALASFGYSVATAGDVNGDGYSEIIVGAHGFDNGEADEGRAMVYRGSAGGLAASPAWTTESNQGWADFGLSVATAGDVNGDGYSDVIVGAPHFHNGQTEEGKAFVYHGSATGLEASPAWTAEGNQTYAHFGVSVATAGDVNGDGYSDIVVGADGFDIYYGTNLGRAFVYHGSATGLGANPAWTAVDSQLFAFFGSSVASAGDVNGDGYSDVIVGARYFDNGQTEEGRAFVYHGSAAGLGASPAWTAEGDQASAYFGWSVATAGDVNGDGYSDVIVGAPYFDNGQTDEGQAFVYHGSAAGLGANPAWTDDRDQASAYFGWSVATAGDVNGDGYSDVVVAAPKAISFLSETGQAHVYHGSAAGLSVNSMWGAPGPNYSEFGHSVATAGDVNGDGYSDVVIGAWRFDNGETNEGLASVYHGSAYGLEAYPTWTAESNQGYAEFGVSVATAGDVNGDGCSDVIVGAHSFDNGETDEGRAFLYYGNEGAGALARPRQRRADDSAPIATLGRTITGSYRASLNVRSPFGRGVARLAVESKAVGAPFDGTGLTQSALADTGTSGADTAVTIGGLAANTRHHWRARVIHDKATTPFLPAGPWFSIQGNGATELDVRTDVCGGTLASAVSYGTGKAGSLGIPVLSLSNPPAQGAWTTLDLTGGLPSASPVFVFAGTSALAVPFDGGMLYVGGLTVTALPPLSGAGTFSIPVSLPVDPGNCGFHVYLQAMFVDPGAAGTRHTAQTNGLDLMLGS